MKSVQKNKQNQNGSKSQRRGRNQKPNNGGKETEINIKDGDINAADLGPMEKRSKRKGSNCNDPSWYTHYPILAPNASGVNFDLAVGSPINYNDDGTKGMYENAVYSAPGIMNIHMIPTIGEASTTVESVSNRVAAQIFTAERQKLGSLANYDATDNMIYLSCMDSSYLLYAFLVKIYGCLRLATPYNFYYLKHIVESMGVDYESFASQMSQFRYDINQFAIFLSSRLVPSFDYTTRHIWLMQNIWADSPTAKAQLYNYVPDAVYVYREVTEGPAYAELVPIPTTTNGKFGYADAKNLINTMVNSAIASTDIDQMSADIGKAFENDVVLLSLIPEDYMTPVSYSQEVLSQIENIRLMGRLYQNSSAENPITGNIIQEVELPKVYGPRLVQNLFCKVSSKNDTMLTSTTGDMLNGCVINFHKQDISYEDILVATRGISCFSRVTNLGTTSSPIFVGQVGTCGSEVYTYATMSMIQQDGSLNTVEYSYIDAVNTGEITQDSLRPITLMGRWVNFDWAPSVKFCNTFDNKMTRMQDLDMYASIDLNQIRALNNNCMFSLFYNERLPKPLK